MSNFSLTLPTLLLTTLFLSACTSTPSSVNVSPQLDENISMSEMKSEHTWSISSDDFRTARYLIAISSGDDVATLVNESSSSRTMIEKSLQAHWSKQGLQFTDKENTPHQLKVQLVTLLAEVEQHTMSHESNIDVVIKIQLSSDKTTFSKTFRSHYEEKAPFSADVGDLTTQLNTQLSQLLDQIVQDAELNAKLLQL